jgi:hypothetical protein
MGKKIITSLYEFVMSQPATKPAPTTVPTTPSAPPAPSRPGRPIPTRVPRPEEEERPMAGIMKNIKKSLKAEDGTKLAKSLYFKLKELAKMGVTDIA